MDRLLDPALFRGIAISFFGCCVGCGQPGSGSAGTGEAPSAASAMGAGSTAPALRASSREGSTIARAPDDSALFVADEDHSAIQALPLPLHDGDKPTSVQLPGRPAQLIATARGLLVTVRELPDGGGALLVMERVGATGAREAARIPLPDDAWALALSPDETTALVTSAWTARLSVIDLGQAKVRATTDVAREPRGVTILPDGARAYVSHLVGSAVTRIDDLLTATPRATKVELPAAPARSPSGKKLGASLGYAAVAAPEGDRVYFPRHALGALGGDAWYGSAAVDVLLTANDEALAPARVAGLPKSLAPFFSDFAKQAPWQPGVQDSTETGVTAFVQPRAAVYRAREATLLVASEGTDTLVELDASMLDPTLGVLRRYEIAQRQNRYYEVATEGGAPTGIALSKDEDTAFVHCRSTDEVIAVRLARGEGQYLAAPNTVVRLAAETADESLSLGRRLFYNATDSIVSGGLGCAGCHPEGRDDGHTWHEVPFGPDLPTEVAAFVKKSEQQSVTFTNFVSSADEADALAERWPGSIPQNFEGDPERPTAIGHPRQTPMLAGRVKARGPYGWHAESDDLVARIVTGFGLHRWKGEPADANNARARAGHLVTFLRQGLVPPPKLKRELSPEEQRGKTIFESPTAGCAGCHLPSDEYTNRTAVPLKRLPARQGFSTEAKAEFKTPSLLYVGGTAPYFHDGRFETLESLLELIGDGMGKTTHLSPEDKKALIAFMRTL